MRGPRAVLGNGIGFVLLLRMRVGAILIFVACLVGCHSKPKQVTIVSERKIEPTTHPTERSAGALAFTPPIAAGERELQLWRDDRQPSAFVGYDEAISQYYYVRSDDRLNFFGTNDTLMRRAVSVRTGISTR